MRVCRKVEVDPDLTYKPPPAEITVQGLGYPGIWSNHGRTEVPAAASEEEVVVFKLEDAPEGIAPETNTDGHL